LERRLAAIFAADVVGYSKLMGEDQVRTLDALRQLRKELFEPLVTEHNGIVIKRMGDGWIVEFASVSDGVNCAIRIQESLAGHDVIRLRIGIHIGEVVIEDEDIYGDGINVAARLEALAEPGQVLISDTAHNSLDAKATERFSGGESHDLKNIARPVAVWRWPSGDETTAIEATVLPLPDKPSIAVLPFDNMSGDPEQEYFSDGISEDIITALSKFHWMLVIARNSSFTYKEQSADIKQVGRELGVRYVLEGSVRKAGNRVRITAQLIEAQSGNHLWADRYDGKLDDIFDLQDQITDNIVSEIEPELSRLEREKVKRKTTNLSAWDWYMRGIDLFNKFHPDTMGSAVAAFKKAIDLDPNFALARAYRAMSLQSLWLFKREKVEAEIVEMLAEARQAVAMDPNEAVTHLVLGRILQFAGDPEGSVLELKKAIELNSNFGVAHYVLGQTLQVAMNRVEEARPHFERALRLSPKDPMRWLFWMLKGSGHRMSGEFQEAVECCQQGVLVPNCGFLAYLHLTAAQAASGNIEAAKQALAQTTKLEPEFSATMITDFYNTTNAHPEILENILVDLRKAGLPE